MLRAGLPVHHADMKTLIAALSLLPFMAQAQESIRLAPEAQRLRAMAARLAARGHRTGPHGVAGQRTAGAREPGPRRARVVDALHLRQVWAGNEALLLSC